jgi:hypothetical protein
MKRYFSYLFFFVVFLNACSSNSQPQKTVEKYLLAISNQDAAALSALSCKTWETDALMTLESFQAVTLTIDGLRCEQAGIHSSGRTIVTCQGKLIASYQGELQEFDLSIQQYLVESVNGAWLVCGTN